MALCFAYGKKENCGDLNKLILAYIIYLSIIFLICLAILMYFLFGNRNINQNREMEKEKEREIESESENILIRGLILNRNENNFN